MPSMSGLKTAITRTVTAALTSNARRGLIRTVTGLGRRLSGQAPTVEYFHQVDDPYSHLITQLLTPTRPPLRRARAPLAGFAA